jgi:hypothetical protein
VLFILLLALLIRRLGEISLVLAGATYACILVLKFAMSETYIQPGNFYAAATAIVPYLVGLVALVSAGWLMWPHGLKRA